MYLVFLSRELDEKSTVELNEYFEKAGEKVKVLYARRGKVGEEPARGRSGWKSRASSPNTPPTTATTAMWKTC